MARHRARAVRTRSSRDWLGGLIRRPGGSGKPAILGVPAAMWLAILWFAFADNALATRIAAAGDTSEIVVAELGDRAVNATEAVVAAAAATIQFASAVVAVVIDLVGVLSRLPAHLIA